MRLEAGPARAFVQRAELVIEAGRPDCPFCGSPIDPEGHLCVRANGFRRRDPDLSAVTIEPGLLDRRAHPPRPGDAGIQRDLRRRDRRTARRLQAGRGGAAAVGLPRRHARRPRGGGVPRLGGARLGHRAADVPARRAARSGHGAAVAGAGPGAGGRTLVRDAGCPRAASRLRRARRPRPAWSRWCTRTPPELRRMAVFDAVVNNADRKGGHVLAMTGGHRYGVDHGADLPRRAQAPHRAVGLGRRARSTDEDRACLERLSDRLEDELGERLARAGHRRTRSRRPGAGSSGCCVSAPCRSRARGGAPSRGHPSDARLATACRGCRSLRACAHGLPRTCLPCRATGTAGAGARHRHRRPRRDRAPRPGPAVRLRHHAVRRDPHGPRRDVRRLRPAQPGLAQRRPRGRPTS